MEPTNIPAQTPVTPTPQVTTAPTQQPAPISPGRLRNPAKKRTSIILILIVAVFGAIAVFRSFAATGFEPPMGLMIQVSTLSPSVSPTKLKTYLEDVRLNHRKQSPNRLIYSLVLQDIADKDGKLYTNYLDVIAPYLPGGATATFTNVYVGSVDLAWTGTGSKYIEGIENSAFRNTNVELSTKTAKAFKSRYPKIKSDWYITYEANLSGFWDQNIETSYLAYINQLTTALNGVTNGRTFMWSPAFWTPYRNQPAWGNESHKANFNHFFANVNTKLIIDMQDFVGQSKGASTKEDAVTWAMYLKQNWPTKLTDVQMNVEQFKIDATGALVPADMNEIMQRTQYYQKQGLANGPSWEIRYWHKRLYGN